MRIVSFIDHKKEMVQIFAKAWTDEIFKQRLEKNPEEVLKEFGIPLNKKEKIKIHFHSDSAAHFYINFPLRPSEEELSEEQLKMIVGGEDVTGIVLGSIGAGGGIAAVAAVCAG